MHLERFRSMRDLEVLHHLDHFVAHRLGIGEAVLENPTANSLSSIETIAHRLRNRLNTCRERIDQIRHRDKGTLSVASDHHIENICRIPRACIDADRSLTEGSVYLTRGL